MLCMIILKRGITKTWMMFLHTLANIGTTTTFVTSSRLNKFSIRYTITELMILRITELMLCIDDTWSI